MKRLIMAIIIAAGVLSGCSGNESKETGSEINQNTDAAEEGEEETAEEAHQEEEPEKPESKKAEKSSLTLDEFDEVLKSLPLSVIETNYAVQSDTRKTLYPDMLQAVIMNNTEFDIKDAVVAFVAWDSNNLPVKIKGDIDFSGGAYVKNVAYSDINLVGGDTFGESNGFSIDSSIEIESFKAIVVSFESFDGEKWENPYLNDFLDLYEGKKYNEDAVVEIEIEDEFVFGEGKKSDNVKEEIEVADLDNLLMEQDVAVISTAYKEGDSRYSSLYPDMLQAVIKNNTEQDIKDAVVAFVAWDSNNLPVKIKGDIDFSGGAYVKSVNYGDINLVPGATFGDGYGFSIDSSLDISTFKAIVVSYETFEGDTWKNPYYKDFCNAYEGKKLAE